MLDMIRQLQRAGFFVPMDIQVASLARRMVPSASDDAILAAALASRSISLGHACVNLDDYAGKSWQAVLTRERPVMRNPDARHASRLTPEVSIVGSLPADLADWLQSLPPKLFGSGSECGNDRTLFVQKDARIYLRRYWDYERGVESKLIELTKKTTGLTATAATVASYFTDDQMIQKQAVQKAVANRLSLLSGGPGTGKTYTLARAVAVLGALHHDREADLIVRMVAPTGKAALRMVESIKNAKRELLDDLRKNGRNADHIDAIPEAATTIHRLLGPRYHAPYFKHDNDNHLLADMVIVDEASMVDLPLMAKLLDALPENCSLMLVGDTDQLASVEPGRVYGDLCHAAEADGPLTGSLSRLTTSRRFPDDSAIGSLSRLINAGEANRAWETLQKNGDSRQLAIYDSSKLTDSTPAFTKLVKEQMQAFARAKGAKEALDAAAGFRILCALRHGPHGVNTMNRRIERILSEMGISPAGGFYDHQLIMIKTNTPTQDLYNGDIGIVLTKPDDNHKFEVWFPDAEHGVRSIPTELLPEHETAFAMTVHKAQGSEFSTIAFVLPDEASSPVLTRELLYTGITRVAIKANTGCLHLWCSENSFKAAVNKQTLRSSGLFKG